MSKCGENRQKKSFLEIPCSSLPYLVALGVFVCSVTTTGAQSFDWAAYYSLQGRFFNGTAQQDFVFRLNDAVRKPETYSFNTFHHTGSSHVPGGTNAAGDLIPPGGFDPVLKLYDIGGSQPVLVAENDDGFWPEDNRDALLTWQFPSTRGGYLNSPIHASNYRLNLRAYDGTLGTLDQKWAVDLRGPAVGSNGPATTGMVLREFPGSASALNLAGGSLRFGSYCPDGVFCDLGNPDPAMVELGPGGFTDIHELVVGQAPPGAVFGSGHGVLNLHDTTLQDVSAIVGASAGSRGQVTMTDNAIWRVPFGGPGVTIGDDGDGHLLIERGSVADFSSVRIGAAGSGDGFVDVDGPASRLKVLGALEVGQNISPVAGSGTLNIANNARVEKAVGGSVLIRPTGIVNLTSGGVLDPPGLVSNTGLVRVNGSGSIVANPFQNAGTVQVDVGQLTITGDSVFEGSSLVSLPLSAPCTHMHRHPLEVSGAAGIDGRLNIASSSIPDPARGIADDFVLISAGIINGWFSDVTYDSILLVPDKGLDANGSFRSHQGNGLFRNLTYSPTDVVLTNYLALEGDANGDGIVNAMDLNAIALNWQSTSGVDWLEGDFNQDGQVNAEDLNALGINWGRHASSIICAPLAAAVPEPTALILAALALPFCLWANGRRRPLRRK